MARLLRRLGVQISWRQIITRTVYESFWKDNCLSMAAQLAYYFFFALFPTLLFIVALASYFPVTSLIDDMFRTFGGFLPPEALQIITDQIVKISNSKSGGLLSLGVLLALSSSSAAMTAIIDTLNHAYGIEETRSWWKVRLTAMALTISVSIFILVSFALTLTGPTLATRLADVFGLGPAFELLNCQSQLFGYSFVRIQTKDPIVFALLGCEVFLSRITRPAPNEDPIGKPLGDFHSTVRALRVNYDDFVCPRK